MKVIIRGIGNQAIGAELSLKEILDLQSNYQRAQAVFQHNRAEDAKKGKKNIKAVPDLYIGENKIIIGYGWPFDIEEFEQTAQTRKGFLIRWGDQYKIVDMQSPEDTTKIMEYLAKYIDSIEFYDQRLDLWKKNYVEAEAQGVDALNNYKAKSPRPVKLSDQFKIGETTLFVYRLLQRREAMDVDYCMRAMFVSERKEAEQSEIDSLREALKELVFEVITLKQHDEERWKPFAEAYDKFLIKHKNLALSCG
jgi:hypothetical protein